MSHQIRRNTTSFFPNGGTERRNLVKPTAPQARKLSDVQTESLLVTDTYEEDHASEVFRSEDNTSRRQSILSNSTNQN